MYDADSIQMLASHAKKLPLLNAEQEADLSARVQSGSKRAAQKLAEHNMRLVLSVAHKHAHDKGQLPDLVGEGMTGLCEAVQTFDASKGRFTTHATYRIRMRILNFLVATSRIVKTDPKTHWKVRSVRDQLELAGEDSGPEEIAAAMGTDPHKIRAAMMGRDVSTGSPMDGSLESEGSATLGDYLASGDPSPEDVFFEGSTMARIQDRISRFRDTLSDKEKVVLAMRILTDNPASMREVGEITGASRQAVHQIQGRVKAKLRQRLARYWADLQAA